MNAANEKEQKLTLELLNAIDQQSDLSQRNLAQHMGIALGLTNSYLKRCAHKGFVKVSEAPANRFLYYLTPKGFAEKARLTGHYLADSLTFYQQAGESCTELFDFCKKSGKEKILLCGSSELAEIAIIRAMDVDITIAGIYDPNSSLEKLISKPVFKKLPDVSKYDMCLLSDLSSPYDFYKSLIKEIDKENVLIPKVLGINVISVAEV